MATTVELPPDLLERFRRVATARGVDVRELIAQAAAREVERFESEEATRPTNRPEDMTAEEWITNWRILVADMREWTSKHLPPGHFVDDSRESIHD